MRKLLQILSDLYQYAFDKHESKIVNNILKMESFEPVCNVAPKRIYTIAFVVPTLKKYAGGHTSILRLGTCLVEKGYNVCYVSFHNQDKIKMEKVAHDNLPGVKGKFYQYSEFINNKCDVCIATSWESVYWAKQLFGYKIYFVQDFEPYFFKLSERYLLALKTYELGFHIVSLGKWNTKQIENSCTLTGKMEIIDFPYEPSEYKAAPRDFSLYAHKSNVSIAVYTKEEGKRIPNMLQGILLKASEELKNHGITLNIKFFGLKSNHRVIVGTNCGKLNKTELAELYRKSDFGMVASMTNISLVPYEMIAVGLPVIEFSSGSYGDFLPVDSAILVDYNYRTLVNAILEVLKTPDKLGVMTRKAKRSIQSLSWRTTGKEFEEILKRVEGEYTQ